MLKWILLISTLLMGCAGTPGYVSTQESQVDGSKTVLMAPGWFGNMLLGAYKTSEMDKDYYLMSIYVPWTCSYQEPKTIVFKIDGQLDTIGQVTDAKCETNRTAARNETTASFSVSRAFLNRLVGAQTVYVKWGVAETKMSTGPTTAHSGLQDFLAKVDQFGL